jgi:hypothetical protein
MKPMIRSVQNLLDTYSVALGDRSYMLALGLARCIAYDLPIPTTAVDVPLSYFALNHTATINDLLGDINEQVVINMELASSLIKKLWLMRYNVVYDSSNVAVQDVLDSIISKGSPELPPNMKEMYARYTNRGFMTRIADMYHESVEGSVAA